MFNHGDRSRQRLKEARAARSDASALLHSLRRAFYRGMIGLGKYSWLTFLAAIFATALHARAATNSMPDFKEVYELIRAHAVGLGEDTLNRAAVNGLLNELGPRASLLTNGVEVSATVVTQLVSRAFVFEDEIAYLRVARVADGLAPALREAYQKLGATNKLKGVVLDLRFTGGSDYPAALAAAELFSVKKPAALDWGKGAQEIKTSSELISVPLVVLVNGETRVAAETLAALLREAGAGLVLGSSTAGGAMLMQDFSLSNGANLRIATSPVKLNGVELAQIRPDIEVPVNAKDEQAFYADAFFVLPGTNSTGLAALANRPGGTNAGARRPRLNEAGLVRAHRQGLNPDEEGALESVLRERRSVTPVIIDPVLARALDLLKGLAIVRQSRP